MKDKFKKIYVCSKCDAQSLKWSGQCSECGSWGTFTESEIKNKNKKIKNLGQAGEVIKFEKIQSEDYPRIQTGIGELDRVLGGGFVPGSLVLLSGEPGIGKSTLVLQIAEMISNPKSEIRNPKQIQNSKFLIPNSVLYVSGEESAEQIKMRIDRLGLKAKNLNFLGETNVENICATIVEEKPSFVIIDSIQTLNSSSANSEAGSVAQVRNSTVRLLEIAKKEKIPILIIAHITKDGSISGPKTLEHLVDAVFYLEGDPYHQYRLLRSIKNRFGSTNEVGVFEMSNSGLKEVKNPSEAFLSHKEEKNPGSAIAAIMAGGRSFLVEVQALVAQTHFGYPQRRVVNMDFNRAQLLIAVLSRRLGLPLGNFDIHLNIVGGIEVKEPALDLAIAMAIISAYKNKPVTTGLVVFGEIGLAGEIRRVNQEEKRISEAKKLGFKKIIKPASGTKITDSKISAKGGSASGGKDLRLKISEVKNLKEAMAEAFE